MRRQYEFTLWVLVMVAGIHFLEEYALDLRSWLEFVLKVPVTWEQCHVVNAALMLFAVGGACVGWRAPALSLIMPAVFVINGLAFHVAFSIIWQRYSPGAVTSAVLFVPAGLWSFVGAHRDGVLTRPVLYCAIAGGVAWHLYLLAFHLAGPPR
jgi:hypothetical protein